MNRCFGISSLLPFEETIKYLRLSSYRDLRIQLSPSSSRSERIDCVVGPTQFNNILFDHRCIIHELPSMSPAIFIAIGHERRAAMSAKPEDVA